MMLGQRAEWAIKSKHSITKTIVQKEEQFFRTMKKAHKKCFEKNKSLTPLKSLKRF